MTNDDGSNRPARRADLNARLRAAFIQGAEEESQRRLGRGLTRDELERVLRRFPVCPLLNKDSTFDPCA